MTLKFIAKSMLPYQYSMNRDAIALLMPDEPNSMTVADVKLLMIDIYHMISRWII